MMSQRVTLDGKVKGQRSGAEAKASVNSAHAIRKYSQSSDVDTKPSDLSMTRLKQR